MSNRLLGLIVLGVLSGAAAMRVNRVTTLSLNSPMEKLSAAIDEWNGGKSSPPSVSSATILSNDPDDSLEDPNLKKVQASPSEKMGCTLGEKSNGVNQNDYFDPVYHGGYFFGVIVDADPYTYSGYWGNLHLKKDSVITEVNGEKIHSVADFKEKMKMACTGKFLLKGFVKNQEFAVTTHAGKVVKETRE